MTQTTMEVAPSRINSAFDRIGGAFQNVIENVPGRKLMALGLASAALFGGAQTAKAGTEKVASAKVANVATPICDSSIIYKSGAASAEDVWVNYMGAPEWPHVKSPKDVNTELQPNVRGNRIQSQAHLTAKEMKALRNAPTCVAPLKNGQIWQHGFSGDHVNAPSTLVNYKNNVPAGGLNAFYKVAHVGNETLVMGDPGCGNVLINRFFNTPTLRVVPPKITKAPVTPAIRKTEVIVTIDNDGNRVEKQIPVETGKFTWDEYVYQGGKYNWRTHKVVGGVLLKHAVVHNFNNPQKVTSGPSGSNFLFVERPIVGYQEPDQYEWVPNLRGDNNPKTIDKIINIKNVELAPTTPPPTPTPTAEACVSAPAFMIDQKGIRIAVNNSPVTAPINNEYVDWGDGLDTLVTRDAQGNIVAQHIYNQFGNYTYSIFFDNNGNGRMEPDERQPQCSGPLSFGPPLATPQPPITPPTTPPTTPNTPKGNDSPPSGGGSGDTGQNPPDSGGGSDTKPTVP